MSNKTSSSLAISLLVIVPLIAIIGFLSMSYNGLVNEEEEVFSAWSQVESNYQRRADLVPNLVKTVQAYADQELKAIGVVTDARGQSLKNLVDSTKSAAQANEEAGKSLAGAKDKLGDEQAMENIVEQQKAASDQLTAMIVMAEAYPDLRSSDNFLMLQDQLEGTENRINNARMIFNEKAGTFNAHIRRIPGSLLAGLGGFERKAYFKADEGANKATAVDFGKE